MLRRVSWTGLAALVAAAAFAGGAKADFWLSGTVYDGGEVCVLNNTTMQTGYAAVTVQSTTNQGPFQLPNYSCAYRRSVPYPYLAAMWQTYKYVWNPYGNWALCGQQGWEYGSGDRMTVGRGLNGCGSAWYFIQGGTYVRNGDTFYGGWLWPQSSQWFNY